MALPSNRKWLSLAALAIIIPISVLTTFKLSGIIPEPPTIAKTIETETITWNMTRPSNYTIINKWIKNGYNDQIALTSLNVHIASYFENDPAFDTDCLWFTINFSTKTVEGFVHSMSIELLPTDSDSYLLVHLLEPWPKLYNLEMKNILTEGRANQQACVYTAGFMQSKECSCEIIVSWHFVDENNTNHQVNAAIKSVYYNSTDYNEVVMPLQLQVLRS